MNKGPYFVAIFLSTLLASTISIFFIAPIAWRLGYGADIYKCNVEEQYVAVVDPVYNRWFCVDPKSKTYVRGLEPNKGSK